MTIREFAAKLDGRQYGDEMRNEEEKLAKELDFLVVFGASDDLAELRGAMNAAASTAGNSSSKTGIVRQSRRYGAQETETAHGHTRLNCPMLNSESWRMQKYIATESCVI